MPATVLCAHAFRCSVFACVRHNELPRATDFGTTLSLSHKRFDTEHYRRHHVNSLSERGMQCCCVKSTLKTSPPLHKKQSDIMRTKNTCGGEGGGGPYSMLFLDWSRSPVSHEAAASGASLPRARTGYTTAQTGTERLLTSSGVGGVIERHAAPHADTKCDKSGLQMEQVEPQPARVDGIKSENVHKRTKYVTAHNDGKTIFFSHFITAKKHITTLLSYVNVLLRTSIYTNKVARSPHPSQRISWNITIVDLIFSEFPFFGNRNGEH